MRARFALTSPGLMLAVLVCALCGSSRVAAQAADQDLAKQLTNPVSDLVSVPFQFNWENNVGPDDRGMRMVLNFQPVVPIPLSDRWNLIARWIMPYIAQPEALGSSSGFGDVVFSTFFSPARPSTLIWGVGPVLSLPMTTDPTLGAGKWSAGPTAVVLRSQGRWTYGTLVNQLWSFANASSDDRAAVSQAFIQPFIAHVTAGGVTYNLTSEATVNWSAEDSGDRWTVPIILQVSKLTRFGPLPLSALAGAGWYLATPDAGPDWKLRTAFVILLPRRSG